MFLYEKQNSGWQVKINRGESVCIFFWVTMLFAELWQASFTHLRRRSTINNGCTIYSLEVSSCRARNDSNTNMRYCRADSINNREHDFSVKCFRISLNVLVEHFPCNKSSFQKNTIEISLVCVFKQCHFTVIESEIFLFFSLSERN